MAMAFRSAWLRWHLIAPQGIEIKQHFLYGYAHCCHLIAPQGIEMLNDELKKMDTRTHLIAPQGIEIFGGCKPVERITVI